MVLFCWQDGGDGPEHGLLQTQDRCPEAGEVQPHHQLRSKHPMAYPFILLNIPLCYHRWSSNFKPIFHKAFFGCVGAGNAK